VFNETFKLLQQPGGQVSFSPMPLEADDDDDDILARGTNLESQYVLSGFARRPAPGGPLLLTVKLHQVKLRTVLWSESFDAAKIEAGQAAGQIIEAVRARIVPAPPAPPATTP
jgi:TolB-like protein